MTINCYLSRGRVPRPIAFASELRWPAFVHPNHQLSGTLKLDDTPTERVAVTIELLGAGNVQDWTGFFASLQYGVLFPMAGLGPLESQRASGGEFAGFSSSTAQTLRGVLGVMY